MLDRDPALGPQPPHEVAAEPAGALAREGRDDDLVDPLVVRGLHGGGEGIGVRDLPVGVDALAAQLRERGTQTPLGLGVLGPRGVALRADDEEAHVPLPRPRADPVEQRLPEDGLVRDDEDVCPRTRRGIHNDVLDGSTAGDAPDLVHEVLPQPPGLRLRVGRDDDLGDLLGVENVLDSGQRVVVEHGAVRGYPRLAERRQRAVEAAAGGSAARVAVDDVALARLRDGSDDEHADRPLGRAALQHVDELGPDERLVRDHEDRGRRGLGLGLAHACTSSSSRSFAGLMTACRAPGTPYS